ncbi:MAG: hypothetical protein DRR19_02770 [Candidatus Parabeggiatoa sp. nov. 1]|nr:MAG: hypothetical protein DRR19_02770 [Gammaproteobacteria bacterium]
MAKSKKTNKLIKSLNHIKLDLANIGKPNKLNELGDAYIFVVQSYIDYIFENDLKKVSGYDDLPEIPFELSERYKRCAWQQAAGIMKSFYANNYQNTRQCQCNPNSRFKNENL